MFIAQHKYKPIDLHQMGDADRLNDWMDGTNHSTLLSLSLSTALTAIGNNNNNNIVVGRRNNWPAAAHRVYNVHFLLGLYSTRLMYIDESAAAAAKSTL